MSHKISYDRAQLTPRAAHIGVGAFHRAHQQVYYDDLARLVSQDGKSWGVVGINLTSPDISQLHVAQGARYSVLTDDGNLNACREVGTLMRVIDADDAASFDWSGIDFATLTITEKGYCHRAGGTDLDPNKVSADIASPNTPTTAIGYLALMLDQRRQARGNPITLASCDNVADNGLLLGSVVRAYMEQVFPDSLTWLDDNVTFPTSMVDRIVPAMSDTSRSKLEMACGGKDALGVVAEPFRQWVMENKFASNRPKFELAGAQIVDDLAPYEHMKHRMLNGLQSAYAELGRLCGFNSSDGASNNKDLQLWADVFLKSQASTLICPNGENLKKYGRISLKRLQNPTIHHPLNQIASDASFKLPQRIGAPAADLLNNGHNAEAQAMVIAGWVIKAGDTSADENGVVTTDPMARQLETLRQRHNASHSDLANAFLALPIWPKRVREDANFAALTTKWVKIFSGATAAERLGQIQKFSKEHVNA